ncbi:MAG: putative acyltransferase [Rhodothermales bacterium]|jgi:predicted acyltransferase
MESTAPPRRLESLDFFRGLTMFLLIAEAAGVYEAIASSELSETMLGPLTSQFHHHPWNGLRFWDLVQPFFMFIVGVAMPFSFARRWARGDSYASTVKHAGVRSFILLALGVGVYVVAAGHLTLELWDVLAQLSVTYFIAFLLMRKSLRTQFIWSIGLLLASEMVYRLWAVPGFNQPFTPDQNFGSWMDLVLMGKLSGGHWVAFNAIPTSAHTIWGVMAGLVLQSDRGARGKIKILVLAGLAGVVVGYGLDPITPIIKRICTSSFVIVSGGWCLLALAFSYWLIDVKGIKRWSKFLMVFGMNPLAVYVFGEIGGDRWLRQVVSPFTEGVLGWSGEGPVLLITALVVLGINWYVVNWLYDRKLFIRI